MSMSLDVEGHDSVQSVFRTLLDLEHLESLDKKTVKVVNNQSVIKEIPEYYTIIIL